ncbi:uncharacterized protein LOC125940032 [Dermacentor silvarum]|uniref:uncharacterized protein LOC125940032 n=1 Tax=Dermacentor silvarum TaxID=543639 RepID=UPI002100F577|nr:uncharacterized protein LOC125940032 [Dermacentor silvarum]
MRYRSASWATGTVHRVRSLWPRSISSTHARAHRGGYDMAPMKACKELPDNFAELSRNLKYDEGAASLVTFSDTLNLALVFENEHSIRQKLCEFKEHYIWMNVSVVMYDMEADTNRYATSVARFGDCEHKFNLTQDGSRVYLARQMEEFLRVNITTPEDLPKCYSLPIYQPHSTGWL